VVTGASGTTNAARVRRPPRRGAGARAAARDIAVRPAQRADLDQVIAIDKTVTGLEKRDYWHAVFRRYAANGLAGRQFLVADAGGRVAGFVIGEVRDWEFGSPPCGWEASARACSPRSASASAAPACKRCARCSRETTRSCCRSSAARG